MRSPRLASCVLDRLGPGASGDVRRPPSRRRRAAAGAARGAAEHEGALQCGDHAQGRSRSPSRSVRAAIQDSKTPRWPGGGVRWCSPPRARRSRSGRRPRSRWLRGSRRRRRRRRATESSAGASASSTARRAPGRRRRRVRITSSPSSCLAAGEVVVERAEGGVGLGDHLFEPGARVALAAEELGGRRRGSGRGWGWRLLAVSLLETVYALLTRAIYLEGNPSVDLGTSLAGAAVAVGARARFPGCCCSSSAGTSRS